MSVAEKRVTAADEIASRMLLEIARRHGTPTYAFDVRRLRAQVDRLRTHLPPAVDVLYSLKANASLGICDVFRSCGIGADVASAGELALTARRARFLPGAVWTFGESTSPYPRTQTL